MASANFSRAWEHSGKNGVVRLDVRPNKIASKTTRVDGANMGRVLTTEPMGDDCYLTFDTARWHVFAKDTGIAYF